MVAEWLFCPYEKDIRKSPEKPQRAKRDLQREKPLNKLIRLRGEDGLKGLLPSILHISFNKCWYSTFLAFFIDTASGALYDDRAEVVEDHVSGCKRSWITTFLHDRIECMHRLYFDQFYRNFAFDYGYVVDYGVHSAEY